MGGERALFCGYFEEETPIQLLQRNYKIDEKLMTLDMLRDEELDKLEKDEAKANDYKISLKKLNKLLREQHIISLKMDMAADDALGSSRR